MNTYLQMVLAGAFFGAWPLCMNRSGLNGINATIVLEVIMLAIALPFFKAQPISSISWTWAFAAGSICVLGLIIFNFGISKLKPTEIGPFLVLMIVVQTAVPALYHLVLRQGVISVRELCGFGTAILTAFLLAK